MLEKLLCSTVFISSKLAEMALLEMPGSALLTALTSPHLAKKVNVERSKTDKTRRIS